MRQSRLWLPADKRTFCREVHRWQETQRPALLRAGSNGRARVAQLAEEQVLDRRELVARARKGLRECEHALATEAADWLRRAEYEQLACELRALIPRLDNEIASDVSAPSAPDPRDLAKNLAAQR